jgi:type II secretory pathway pseudopilin PulG
MRKVDVKAKGDFTLLEIVVAVAVLMIISSIAVVSYTRYIGNPGEKVCAENLNGLRNAIMIYVSEKAALPTTLGELEPEQIKQGYDLAMKNADWKSKLAHAALELSITAEVHAFTLSYEDLKAYGANHEIFHCPEDHNGGTSYAINADIAGKKWSEINADVVLIAESDSDTFSKLSDLQLRHEGRKKALAITKIGRIIKLDHIDSDGDGDDGDDVIIYHKEKPTKTKSGSALGAHWAHGDTIGACP